MFNYRLVFFSVFLFVTSFSAFAQTKKPNIIFILTDDQRWDALGIAGNSIVQTPEMDALANSGTYFKNAYFALIDRSMAPTSISHVHQFILKQCNPNSRLIKPLYL